MGLLTRDVILGAPELMPVRVDVPEMGEGAFVYVRGLTGLERDQWEAQTLLKESGTGAERWVGRRAALVVRGVVDEQGNRIFTDADADRLNQKCSGLVDRLYRKIEELSGLGN
jgi:hypothetical protein